MKEKGWGQNFFPKKKGFRGTENVERERVLNIILNVNSTLTNQYPTFFMSKQKSIHLLKTLLVHILF